jgi:hypothetical protein
MTDDLDALLSDVDGGPGLKKSDESLLYAERTVRRSDRPVVDAKDPSSVGFFRERINGLRLDGDLDPFRMNFSAAAELHSSLSNQFRDTIFSNLVSESVSMIIKKYRYAYEKALGNIEQAVSDYIVMSGIEKLQKESRQDFFMFFAHQEITDGRLDFLLIKDLFLTTREFNTRIKKEWQDLQKGINVINMTMEGKQLYSLCFGISAEALVLCDKTSKFISFLASLMMLDSSDLDILDREIPNKVVYFDTFDYNLKKILSTMSDMSAKAEKTQAASSDDFLDISSESKSGSNVPEKSSDESRSDEKENERSAGEAAYSEPPEESVAKVNFTVKGTSSWNTREPYVMKIETGALLRDYSDLESSIYFSNDIPDPVAVNGQVKRAMILFMKNPERTIISEYSEFVLRFISFKIDTLFDFFGFTGETSSLFAYHLAPVTVHKIMVSHFQETGQGVCFKLMSGNKVTRIVPAEYLKEKVLNWFENNINVLDLPFDKVSDYNEIKRKVQEKYFEARKKNEEKVAAAVERLRQQSGKQADPALIMQKKAHELFGLANIHVYNRFLDKTGLR